MALPIHLTYVGNTGIVAGSGGDTVAVDALFGEGAAPFAETPSAAREALETARGPFARVDILLATHHHPDHFDPRAVGRHLSHNATARLVTTPQAAQLLEAHARDGYPGLAPRVHTLAPPEGQRESCTICALRVEAFGLSHGRVHYGDVQHLGFVVHLGGRTVVHLGDGIIDRRALEAAGLLGGTVDVAVLPFWYFTYPLGRRLLVEDMRPRAAFAVHMPLARRAGLARAVAGSVDWAVPLVREMSTHEIPPTFATSG